MNLSRFATPGAWCAAIWLSSLPVLLSAADKHEDTHKHAEVHFSIKSSRSGNWSDPKTWTPQRVPHKGDRVIVNRGTDVRYDVSSKDVLRLVQVVGTLRFARDRNTEMNVAILKVQNSDKCSESGFACDFRGVNRLGEPDKLFPAERPQLLIGTPEDPIPAKHTAVIRLHYIEGMDKRNAPALVCCSARMEIHGAPMKRTWVKLGADARASDKTVTLAHDVPGWKVGHTVIVTGSIHRDSGGSFRGQYGDQQPETESRRITKIDGTTLTLDKPLKYEHFGSGEFRSEVANLSRNVVVESADPKGVRGHTLYHRYSTGGLSYARFAHLGKEGVLGRYAIHYHLVRDTMRGSQVKGVAIVDSHNRWITVHGTQYLVVRDCVGYRSVGHGFFLEDGTEVYNLFDHNLGVQAYRGKRLPNQVLPFDPNDGAAFWWTNGRNSLVRNVACENDRYGFRYDCQGSRSFDIRLPVMGPDGKRETVDVREIPIYRFEQNESHTEGLYGMAFAGKWRDGTRPARPRHAASSQVEESEDLASALRARPQIPQMLIENVHIERAVYGIYRPMYDNHVYRNLRISNTSGEPFNRGLDDQSNQYGKLTVDGLSFAGFYEGSRMPLIQMSDNNVTGQAESHFRKVSVTHSRKQNRRPWFDRGGGAQVSPVTEKAVPYYVHDHLGRGRDVRILSRLAKKELAAGGKYRDDKPLTGRDAVVGEIKDVEFPELLKPVDDLPPATIITSVRREGSSILVHGVSHDNGQVAAVTVNDKPAKIVVSRVEAGVVDWKIQLDGNVAAVTARATDKAGNIEQHLHRTAVPLGVVGK